MVDTWKSVKGEEHLIERLTAGETYTLREEMAPYGYLMAEEVSFTVDDTAEIQKSISMSRRILRSNVRDMILPPEEKCRCRWDLKRRGMPLRTSA